MTQTLIQYIGLKPQKIDTTCGTGLTWLQGECLPVDDKFLPALLKHTDVWRQAAQETEPVALSLEAARARGLVVEAPSAPAPEATAPAAQTPDGNAQSEKQPGADDPQEDAQQGAEQKQASNEDAAKGDTLDPDKLEAQLSEMSDQDVRAFATSKGLTIAKNSRGSALRSKVLAMLTEA